MNLPAENNETPPKIFWSWQSDKSAKTCRHFIRQCLAKAVEQIASEEDTEEAKRPELDQDTKGTAGMVDIASTIFDKIAVCDVFVADLTPIGISKSDKHLPNPNVMIELGWALKSPGMERVIGVLNSAHGARPEDLPFDIRSRRIITYSLEEDAGKADRQAEAATLTEALKAAIETNLESRAEQNAAEMAIRGVDAKPENISIWATAKDTLTHNDSFEGTSQVTISTDDVPRSYMRVIPAGWKADIPSISAIRYLPDGEQVEAPHGGGSAGAWGATEEGFVRYWKTNVVDYDPHQASDMTMFFEDTGEFWMLNGGAVFGGNECLFVSPEKMLGNWSKMLRQSLHVMEKYSAYKSVFVEAGVMGIKNAHWYIVDKPMSSQSRRESSVHRLQTTNWNDAAQLTFLTKAFNGVSNLFTIGRSSESEIEEFLKRCDRGRFSG